MEPRIPPVSLEDADPDTRRLLERLSKLRGDDAAVLNVFGTIANHPQLLREWLKFIAKMPILFMCSKAKLHLSPAVQSSSRKP